MGTGKARCVDLKTNEVVPEPVEAAVKKFMLSMGVLQVLCEEHCIDRVGVVMPNGDVVDLAMRKVRFPNGKNGRK